ncbi:hypothetical protein CW711_01945 [Candidatus Bathyarchaeota archaeon]|mgnify:FL=1|nr:MAG: hypothetical protein CW680_00315 [Candidatus Bathyarchaeota archaeon]RJS79805.1 MAG: hypothetical protein CW711_01945 [Candidatus Bathyarchaeota archaeon]
MEDNPEDYVKNPLWPILVETVHAMSMYPHHKAYISEKILPENPEITPRELSAKMGIPFGEALVILFEVREERTKTS